ncbi:hypothetical protein PUN28_015514 [Cardiocondyla obscurior]|uniref:Uncharacterized protein n=1 Tax=Cardiocondyla obscurior TaxID=286306 RepID=A0AAW2EV40_9HYME
MRQCLLSHKTTHVYRNEIRLRALVRADLQLLSPLSLSLSLSFSLFLTPRSRRLRKHRERSDTSCYVPPLKTRLARELSSLKLIENAETSSRCLLSSRGYSTKNETCIVNYIAFFNVYVNVLNNHNNHKHNMSKIEKARYNPCSRGRARGYTTVTSVKR